MTNDETKVTCLLSFIIILLKEVRHERNIHQAQLGEMAGKTPNAWTKIETGRSPMTFEVYLRICNGLQLPPSYVLAAAERHSMLFTQNGWAVLGSQLEFNEDALLKLSQEYWSSPGYRKRAPHMWGYQSVLNGPIYNQDGSITIAPVFQFILDPTFRAEQLTD
ncbi:helix-turn-helix domain-containing protein [Halomonas sp. ATBC28]|uniref:helix-turn-helix domain-containing protein n=1 Tax=Halomonadaceae TaxID=28256 RepID=UPI001BB1BD49|nr:helix-turn-helix transcriptional regulator [Halomonas sp. ATBC28]